MHPGFVAFLGQMKLASSPAFVDSVFGQARVTHNVMVGSTCAGMCYPEHCTSCLDSAAHINLALQCFNILHVTSISCQHKQPSYHAIK
jgi:hypothetical protein